MTTSNLQPFVALKPKQGLTLSFVKILNKWN